MVRNFLFGVGEVISGIFCVVVNPPIAGKFGVGLVIGGSLMMWHAVNDMYDDSQDKKSRLKELENLQKQAEEAAQTPK